MALTIICVSCGVELTEPGGILLTAPDDQHQVTKHHMCPGCTDDALDYVLSTIESPGGHEPAHPQPLVHVLADLPMEPGDALAHVLAEVELRCTPGQTSMPTSISCNRHNEHHWCPWCRGYYGVPHYHRIEGVLVPTCHTGNPKASYDRKGDCACRWCKDVTMTHEQRDARIESPIWPKQSGMPRPRTTT